MGALDATATEELGMRRMLGELPFSSFGRLTGLASIDISYCIMLLRQPHLTFNMSRTAGRLFSGLTSLTSIEMSRCEGLTSLPDGRRDGRHEAHVY